VTISVAWVRKINRTEELVFASDSRLSFGGLWDCCPKILPFPRDDAAISFAGDTHYAYPVMLQAMAAISQHPRSLNRAQDIIDLKGHLLKVLNDMTSSVHDLPKIEGVDHSPKTDFLLGGWSWKKAAFTIWHIHFDGRRKLFAYRPASRWTGIAQSKTFAFIGDYKNEYRERLVSLLRSKRKLDRGGFDMEPLEVLRDMLRAAEFGNIGGLPQVLKVYKFASCRPYAVTWPDRQDGGRVTLLGRPLLSYEKTSYPLLNLDTMTVIPPASAA